MSDIMIVGLGSTLHGIDDVSKLSPPTDKKKIGTKTYEAWVLTDTKRSAETITKRIRNLGYLARIGKHDITNRDYTVWVSE